MIKRFIVNILLTMSTAASYGMPTDTITSSVSNAKTLTVWKNHHSFRLVFSHTVDGYVINCDRYLMVVWGKPITINESNPQDSDITVVNLDHMKTERTIGFSRGIFGVEFLREKPLAFIATDLGNVVNLETGLEKPPPDEMDFGETNFPRESCADFDFKSYYRYK